jgi:hypothetical protein
LVGAGVKVGVTLGVGVRVGKMTESGVAASNGATVVIFLGVLVGVGVTCKLPESGPQANAGSSPKPNSKISQ